VDFSFDYHIQHTQQLQANLESAAATAAESHQRLAQQPDPSAVFPELEQLRQYKLQMDSEVQTLRSQLSRKQNEISSLQTQLSASSSRAGEVEGAKDAVSAELQKAKETAKSLQDKCDRLQQKSTEDDNQRKSESDKTTELDKRVEELQLTKKALEVKVSDHENVIQSNKNEISHLTEENQRLSKELTTFKNRPEADNVETTKHVTNGVHNGNHTDQDNANTEKLTSAEDMKLLREKLVSANQEYDKLSQEKESLLKHMTQEIEQYKDQLHNAKSELKTQRDKNDGNVEDNMNKMQKEKEQAQKAFLIRLFEDIIDINDSALKNKDHEKWLSSFAEKVTLWKSEVAANKAKGADETSNNEDTTDQLKTQVEHYKGVLGETERMLHQLQSTVETEESRWKSRLGEKEAELEQVRKETQKLSQNNIALEESLKVVNSAEEV
jgi:DNA repair exonuclease SbcCD ATPase subunit